MWTGKSILLIKFYLFIKPSFFTQMQRLRIIEVIKQINISDGIFKRFLKFKDQKTCNKYNYVSLNDRFYSS